MPTAAGKRVGMGTDPRLVADLSVTKTANQAGRSSRPAATARVVIENGRLELVKWLAALMMAGDHVNKYLLHDSQPWLFDAGRMVMPLFALVLAYNLGRDESGAMALRIAKRLLLFGLSTTPVFIALGGLAWGWWPLNILFGLALIAICVWDIQTRHWAYATLAFVIGGSSVEFWWPLVGFGLAAWAYFNTGKTRHVVVGAFCLVLLHPINHNFWALAALPAFWLLTRTSVGIDIPRLRWFFYGFYPVHLGAILLIRGVLQ
jgi:hypothetical protein